MDFSQLPAAEEKTAHVQAMFDAIAPKYELVNRLMTFGLDARWRRAALKQLSLAPGAKVLDLATGTGDLSRGASALGFAVLGADLSLGMLQANTASAPKVQADVAALAFGDASFDGLICGYALRNFTDLQIALNEMARVLRPGARLALLEVCEPNQAFVKFGFNLWFRRVVPFIGGLLSDRSAYQYLPRSTTYLPSPEELCAMVAAAGFTSIKHQRLSGGLSQLLSATRSEASS